MARQGAVYGSFSAPKAHEIVVSRGKGLDLLRPDEHGRVVRVAHAEIFGCVRSLATLRLPGTARDFLVVGSDSGRLAVLRFDKERACFEPVHRETFGRSGCRRGVPGQFLAADPKGRAVMVAAVEKQKLVYIMNRDSEAALTISSPLEAHKAHSLCLCLTALDCGFENPMFAAVELDFSEADADASGAAAAAAQRHLTYYELDLGLNHVVRRWSEPTDNAANMLIAVPGGGDGPGGVLVCCENYILYRHEEHPEVRAALPRRPDLPAERGVLLVASATHRQKSMFFFLVQSEYGDLYKVTLEHSDDRVSDVVVRYFDTLPAPCASVCVLKTGFLFAAAEFGDHALYQFEGLGDDAEEEGCGGETRASALASTPGGGSQPAFFRPRPLKNLSLVDQAESLSPITQMRVANPFGEESPVIFAACGSSGRPSLKALRVGLAASEVAATQLQGTPLGVWTMKAACADTHHASIVVSFVNATMVLSIGATVEEVTDSGLLDKTPTLQVQLLADDSVLQVHPDGLRHVRPDGRVNEWRCPGRKQVVTVSSNPRQVALSLTGGELVYFEADSAGQVVEMERKELASDVACLHITPVPEGRLRSKFLAVGGHDATVRILSLEPEGLLSPLAVQAVAAAPHSLHAMDAAAGGEGGAGGLFLHAGLSNGVLLRTEVDRVGGQLSDTRTRFLGTKPPKLRPAVIGGRQAMLCMSSRPWLGYTAGGRFALTPLAYEALADATGLSSEQCPEGVVAVTKDELRVVLVEGLGETFNSTAAPLSYTPRDFVVDEDRKLVAVIEAEHGARGVRGGDGAAGAGASGMDVDGESGAGAGAANGNGNGAGPPADPHGGGDEGGAGALLHTRAAPPGTWASCVRLVDPAGMQTLQVIELEGNEAAVSMCLVKLEGSEERLLAVGTAANMTLAPRGADGGSIRLYRFAGDAGRSLELIHSTAVDGIPSAMAEFHGRLLVGVGGSLRLYSAGKKRLLKKCENRKFPNFVTGIRTLGERVYVSDASESMFFVRYRSEENQLTIYADDIVPRYMSASCLLDYDTMAGADKFGNVFVSRLPQGLSQDIDEDPAGGRASDSHLRGAPYKLQDVANFHVGDTVTAIDRCALQPGGREFLLYGTVMGEIGALFPVTSSEELEFFSHLEMHMRQESPPLCGRDHMSFRSSYFPVKHVVDGDLCEEFQALAPARQRRVAEELDRSPGEVLKKLEDLRAKMV